MRRISTAPPDPHAEELRDAWLALRSAARRFDHIAKEEGWQRPFAPARYLILAELMQATTYGFSARRIARGLCMVPSTLAHHLDVLEEGGFVKRAEWTVHDGRKVAVRLTAEGLYAVRRLTSNAREAEPAGTATTGSTSSSSSP